MRVGLSFIRLFRNIIATAQWTFVRPNLDLPNIEARSEVSA